MINIIKDKDCLLVESILLSDVLGYDGLDETPKMINDEKNAPVEKVCMKKHWVSVKSCGS